MRLKKMKGAGKISSIVDGNDDINGYSFHLIKESDKMDTSIMYPDSCLLNKRYYRLEQQGDGLISNGYMHNRAFYLKDFFS